MLKLLLGGSGSGKTTLLYQRIRARAEAGEKSILLVPEPPQSSFNMMNLSVGSVFYRGSQKPLPLGEVSPKVTERASPA